MAIRLNPEDFEEKVLKADKPVVVDFYSDTCIPCKRMAGLLGDIEDIYQSQIYIYKINVSYAEKLIKQYGVMSAPTLLLFVNGEEKKRLTGAVKKEAIVALFAEYIQD